MSAALVLGVTLGLALDRPETGAGAPGRHGDPAAGQPRAPAAASDPVLDSLSAVLDAEIAERKRLSDEVETLRRRLQALEGDLANRVTQAFQAQQQEQQQRLAERNREQRAGAAATDARQVLVGQLVEGGFAQLEAERVATEVDRATLAAIDAYDRAVRASRTDGDALPAGGSFATASEKHLRQAIGDGDYDRYLHALGRTNRVSVLRVLGDSPAQRAGLRPGDRIVSYAGERLFSAERLVELTHEGSRGETVALEVDRDGQRLQLYIARGPMGLNTGGERVEPGS